MPGFAPVPHILSQLPSGVYPAYYEDENWAYLLALLNGLDATDSVVPDVETGNGPFVVSAVVKALVLKRLVGGASLIQLPAVGTRPGVPLSISDWNGNAGDITVTPAVGETIMGLATMVLGSAGQGAGTSAGIRIIPSVALGGWFVG